MLLGRRVEGLGNDIMGMVVNKSDEALFLTQYKALIADFPPNCT